MSGLHIQFSTSKAFASGIIRRLTHSPFSHVDFVVDGGLLGVSGKDDSIHDAGGVCMRPAQAWPYLTTPKVAHVQCSEEIATSVMDIARTQIGKPFDHSALWAFFDDQATDHQCMEVRDWRNSNSWFCSELVAWSLEQGGLFPYQLAVAKNRVTPADVLLMINPYMPADNISEFAGG